MKYALESPTDFGRSSLAAFGIGFTAFLGYRLLKDMPVPCFIFTEDSRQGFRSSPYAGLLGIPNPYLGLSGFSALFLMIAANSYGSLPLWPVALVIALFVLFSLRPLYVQEFVVKGRCKWPVTMIATSFSPGRHRALQVPVS